MLSTDNGRISTKFPGPMNIDLANNYLNCKSFKSSYIRGFHAVLGQGTLSTNAGTEKDNEEKFAT